MRSLSKIRGIVAALGLLFVAACYHVTVVTGAPASNQIIDKPWQHAFVSGLVPPAELNTASTCKQGVAKVETEHSFLNGLVAALTGYAFIDVYSPIHVTVTCASGPVKQTAGTR